MSDAPPIASALRRRIENDPWAKTLGIGLLDVRRAHCRLRMQLRSHMVNFQGNPHGFYRVTTQGQMRRTHACVE